MPRLHLHLLSDSTGETLEMIAKAALAQFEGAEVSRHFWPMVRSLQHLDRIMAERWLTPSGTVGLWRCRREGDDVLILAGNDWVRLPFLRQQVKKREGRANLCLADFIDPSGDWIGGFAVGIHGIDPHSARFLADKDDYSDILLKALADRFAEAFAEALPKALAAARG